MERDFSNFNINSQNEASFITIIKNMWRINEEVLEDMFPAFLDKDALTFLIEVILLIFEADPKVFSMIECKIRI